MTTQIDDRLINLAHNLRVFRRVHNRSLQQLRAKLGEFDEESER